MMEKALKHFQAGEFAEAEAIYRTVLEQDPGRSEALFLLAQVRQRQGDLEQPLELLDQVSRMEPFNPNVFHARGVLHIKRNEGDEARKQFQQALEINPGHVESRNGIAFIELAKGRFAAAEHEARLALNEQPDNAQALTYLGTALLEQGHAKEALAVLQHAVKLEPASLTAQCQLGRAFMAAGNASFAVQCFENALQASPESADVLEYLGSALLTAGRPEEAAPHLRQSVANGRANPDLYSQLATCEILLGDPAHAEGLLAAAYKMAPERDDVVLAYAEMLIARDAAEMAASMLQDRVSAGTDEEPVFSMLARAHLKLGRTSAALAVIEPRMANDDIPVQTRLTHIEALEKDDQQHRADALLNAMLEEEPVPAEALLFKASRLYKARDEGCIELLQQALELASLSQQQVVNARYMLANALHRAGRYPEAANLYTAIASRYAEILGIDREVIETETEDPQTAMDARLVSAWPAQAPEDGLDDPVFVIAWPGSGQERLLAALSVHPGVALLIDQGEHQAKRRALINQPRGATALDALQPETITATRKAYWASLRRRGLDADGLQTIDAMWLTVESLPTIYRLFPHARILVIQRDPRDMAVHWMQAGYKSLDVMAKAYSYQLHLLSKCRDSLPLNFVNVDYESLEAAPEDGLRNLLSGLGLAWEDAVLNRFEETTMPVEASSGDWRHYTAQTGSGGDATIH